MRRGRDGEEFVTISPPPEFQDPVTLPPPPVFRDGAQLDSLSSSSGDPVSINTSHELKVEESESLGTIHYVIM